jgi:hypothetical protein
VSLLLQLTHCELALQIWPAVQSPLLRQLPATQVPLWQRWFAPNAVTHWASPVQLVHMFVVALQIFPLQSAFW